MNLYQTIAPWYDQIFPLAPQFVNFVLEHSSQRDAILDVGCATGSLLESLAPAFPHRAGLDLDPDLLAHARERLGPDTPALQLVQASMLDLNQHFAPGSFSLVTCLGNTLPHLASLDEVNAVFRQMRRLLAPGATLIFQIINFDRVLAQGIRALPSLESTDFRFLRDYSAPGPDGHIWFSTTLEVKKTGVQMRNQTALLALRQESLEQALRTAGFTQISSYTDFRSTSWSADGFLTIMVAEA